MVGKIEFQLTQERTEKAINMSLENAESYLNNADMHISNDKTDHLTTPIVFAMKEIGKVKISYDKIENSSTKISPSSRDGIYDHKVKTEKADSLIEFDAGEKITVSVTGRCGRSLC